MSVYEVTEDGIIKQHVYEDVDSLEAFYREIEDVFEVYFMEYKEAIEYVEDTYSVRR